jgi:hypothetical protein
VPRSRAGLLQALRGEADLQLGLVPQLVLNGSGPSVCRRATKGDELAPRSGHGRLLLCLSNGQPRGHDAGSLVKIVQLGRDPRAETGARSVTRATAPGCLLAGTSQAIGKRLCGRIVGTSVAPEYVPKHNSELSGNRGRRPDDAVRLEIGEEEVRD